MINGKISNQPAARSLLNTYNFISFAFQVCNGIVGFFFMRPVYTFGSTQCCFVNFTVRRLWRNPAKDYFSIRKASAVLNAAPTLCILLILSKMMTSGIFSTFLNVSTSILFSSSSFSFCTNCIILLRLIFRLCRPLFFLCFRLHGNVFCCHSIYHSRIQFHVVPFRTGRMLSIFRWQFRFHTVLSVLRIFRLHEIVWFHHAVWQIYNERFPPLFRKENKTCR